MNRWTEADVRAIQNRHAAGAVVQPRRKYGNQPVEIDGYKFDSKKEGEHYLLLKMRERLKEITDLEVHPVFLLYHDATDGRGRIDLGKFTADFRYFERYANGAEVLRVIDVKSKVTKTVAYQQRKRHAEAIYGITITEV